MLLHRLRNAVVHLPPRVLGKLRASRPGSGAFRRGIIVLAVLTFLLGVTNAVLVTTQPSSGAEIGTLSLGKAPPSSMSPLFMVEKGPGTQYLRGAIGIIYTGQEWKLERVNTEGTGLFVTFEKEDLSLRPSELAHSHQEFDRPVLDAARPVSDPVYVNLPDNISQRLMDLSSRITRDCATPFEKAKAIEDYLRTHCRYDPDFVPAPSRWEPNDWFLFESKEGVCGNFASAFVVLARASGLPSRLAAGYFIGGDEGEQFVYEDQAHGWAEVGFEDLGWIVFDPT